MLWLYWGYNGGTLGCILGYTGLYWGYIGGILGGLLHSTAFVGSRVILGEQGCTCVYPNDTPYCSYPWTCSTNSGHQASVGFACVSRCSSLVPAIWRAILNLGLALGLLWG